MADNTIEFPGPTAPEKEMPSRAEMLGGYMANCLQASNLVSESLRRLVALGGNRPELNIYAGNADMFIRTGLMWLDQLANALANVIQKEDGDGENLPNQ